jgi:hypothetical protein
VQGKKESRGSTDSPESAGVCVSAQSVSRVKKGLYKYGRRLFRSTDILVAAFEPY